ncbi:transposase [Saccharopolyspora sp. NPDC050642]|uniref:transposase n=1 Tax=Saccharopolyspora sp. NPDC050642 TaxID=3157099 RepID=UPI003407B58F
MRTPARRLFAGRSAVVERHPEPEGHQDRAGNPLGNQIRSLLKEFFPAAIEAFAKLPDGGLARPDARTVLAATPSPAAAAKLTRTQLRRLLVKAGRRRNVESDMDRLHSIFRTEQLRQPGIIEEAMGIQLTALLAQFTAACNATDELAEAARAHFEQHPDAQIITSFPGLGLLAGARVLAEIGDDRSRFPDARGLKAYAGSAPITRASGKKTVVMHRHIKNRRLAAVGSIWALASLKASPGARRHFDARRATGDWNHQAQRHLFNKFLGQLHHCLQTGQLFDEHRALPPPLAAAA